MLTDFDSVFRPWKKWENKRLTDLNPCDNCETYMEWWNRAAYGSPAEREAAVITGLPASCRSCGTRIQWECDCMCKLQWYENHDERLKGANK